MKRIGARLVRERQLALLEGIPGDDAENGREYGKDLLSLLVRANMTDPEGSSMSDEDVQDRKSAPHLDLVPAHWMIITFTFFVPMQKSPPSSLPDTRPAAPASLGVFIVYPTTSKRRGACVKRSAISTQILQMWNRSSLSSTSITS